MWELLLDYVEGLVRGESESGGGSSRAEAPEFQKQNQEQDEEIPGDFDEPENTPTAVLLLPALVREQIGRRRSEPITRRSDSRSAKD